MSDPVLSSELGIYQEHCGIDNCTLAWGHDEYLYQVLSHHPDNRIPNEGMIMIRYHSFYPWHTGGSYRRLASSQDTQYEGWVKDFNQYDLYSKSEHTYDLDSIKSYYNPLVEKYLGKGPIYW